MIVFILYYKKGVFCLNLSIITDILDDGLPQEFLIEDYSINWKILNKNKAGNISAGAYFLSIINIMSDFQYIGPEGLLIINNYI